MLCYAAAGLVWPCVLSESSARLPELCARRSTQAVFTYYRPTETSHHTPRWRATQAIVPLLQPRPPSDPALAPTTAAVVVLVTHQLQYLTRPEVSRVVVLRDGGLWLSGPWCELAAQAEGSLLRHVAHRAADAAGQAGEENDGCERGVAKQGSGGEEAKDKDRSVLAVVAEDEGRGWPTVQSEPGAVALGRVVAFVRRALLQQQGMRVDGQLVERVCRQLGGTDGEDIADGAEGHGTSHGTRQPGLGGDSERRRSGLITWVDFQVYISVFGTWPALSALVVTAIGNAAFSVLANWWLTRWTDSSAAAPSAHERLGASSGMSGQRDDLGVYAAIGGAGALCLALQTVVLTVCSLRASRSLHSAMLGRLVKAPMAFFDAWPSGRVLNRFLQDLATVDSFVPNAMLNMSTQACRPQTHAVALGPPLRSAADAPPRRRLPAALPPRLLSVTPDPEYHHSALSCIPLRSVGCRHAAAPRGTVLGHLLQGALRGARHSAHRGRGAFARLHLLRRHDPLRAANSSLPRRLHPGRAAPPAVAYPALHCSALVLVSRCRCARRKAGHPGLWGRGPLYCSQPRTGH